MKTLSATLLALVLAGCGSSVQPEQPKDQPPVTAPPDNTPKPAARTIVNRSLLSGSPNNLLLDNGFRSYGWGHFTTLLGSGMATITQQTLSLSPASVTAPVGVFKDPTATDEKSRTITSICSFLGGKGPFIARVWVARTTVAGEPAELVDDPATFRAALTSEGSLTGGKAYDLARKDQKTIGKHTWVLYESKVDADLPATAFFTLVFGRTGGAFLVTAPEVLAVNLLPPSDSKMSLDLPAKVRALTTDERVALDFYVRQPHPLGLPKPTTAKVTID